MISKGASLVLVSCALSALMGLCFEGVVRLAPEVSGSAVGFVRVLANLGLAALLALRIASEPSRTSAWRDKPLWLWAGMGAATIATMFAALPRIGAAATATLGSTSGAFTALLAPLLLGERLKPSVLVAVAASLLGIFLMHASEGPGGDALGWFLGATSGFSAGLAYVAIAMMRGRRSLIAIMLSWSFACLATYAVWFAFDEPTFPQSRDVWLLTGAGGLAAAAAQYFLARAYAMAPAATVGALSFLAPALSLFAESLVFGSPLGRAKILGASAIFGAGIFLAARGKSARTALEQPDTPPYEATSTP